MNLFDSSFLCLDIGTSGVRGIAHRVRSGRIDKSAVHAVDSFDTVFALKTVIDELETQIGTHFDSAYVTGNFGQSYFLMSPQTDEWSGEHRISISDIQKQISRMNVPDGYYPMHIVPLRYDLPSVHNVASPVGATAKKLSSIFGAICYPHDKLSEITGFMRRAHIQAKSFFDPQFLHNAANRPENNTDTVIYLDLGSQFSSASIWTWRGPICHTKIKLGTLDIVNQISQALQIDFEDAMRISRSVSSLSPMEMDRFTPADTAYEFSRADINDIVLPSFVEIAGQLKSRLSGAMSKYKPTRMIITGGGSEIDGIAQFFENAFSIPAAVVPADATVRALSDYIWASESGHRAAYAARHARWHNRANRIMSIFRRKKKTTRPKVLPILPSSLVFKMDSPSTYSMFQAGGISIIHVDIMDGLYVDNIAGSIKELKSIRAHTNAHLHVHLMTESPIVWADDAIAAGANTIILSTNTSGLRTALRNIRASGRRCGVALNPESPVSLLNEILPEIDEVMVMSVSPGAAGQKFNPAALDKISALAQLRQTTGLKFLISVDGGINDKTAQLCWAAGANMLVSGSYLAKSPDFPLAVQSLLPRKSE